jgi:fengycin family lipopeptide synthetase E
MRGYLNKPDLNSKVFVRSVDGASFFRTGDLVSSLETRPLRFHGRFDRQVKLRGFRIELEEIETALLRCGGITGAAVWIAREEEGFHQILAAVETDRATDVTEHSIISQLARSLTPASVPSRVLILHGMPRMANGKIDYLALTAHAESRLSKSSEAAYYD